MATGGNTSSDVVFKLVGLDAGEQTIDFSPRVDVQFGRDTVICQRAFPDVPQLSRLHCRVSSMGRDVFVYDLSSNGTFVNGKQVGKGNNRALRAGDVLCLLNPQLPESSRLSWRFVPPPEAVAADGLSSSSAVPATASPLEQRYELGRVLGTGNFATVRLGKHRVTGETVAVKIIEKKRFAMTQSDFSFASLQGEVEILRKMRHRNIIGMVDVFDDPKTFTMVLELVSDGDFFDYIVGRAPQPFSEAEAKVLFVQLLEAMLYMHSKDVVHRDLKPENILVAVNKTFTIPHRTDDHQRNARNVPVEQVTLKITDFGLAKFCSEHDVMTTMCGTPSYLAPEVLVADPAARGKGAGYSWSVDVWSLGVILYIMLSGCPPKDPQKGKVVFNKYMTDLSADAKALIEAMLHVDPAQRADLADICAHPWLKGVHVEGRELAVKPERLQLSGTVLFAKAPTVRVEDIAVGAVPTLAGSAPSPAAGTAAAALSGGSLASTVTSSAAGGSSAGSVAATTPGSAKRAADDGNNTEVESDGEQDAAAKKRRVDKPQRSNVVWSWKKELALPDSDPRAWQAYGDADVERLEKARARGAKSCAVGGSGDYRISFEGMFQYNNNDHVKQRPVRRVEV